MSKWTDIIDADIRWAASNLGRGATVHYVTDFIARGRGRAYAAQEVQAALQRVNGQSAKLGNNEVSFNTSPLPL